MKFSVADSTFYLCFLEDINAPEPLATILQHLDFVIPKAVYDEVSICKGYGRARDTLRFTIGSSDIRFKEILRPFFSSEQWKKGEAEAITLAFSLFNDDSLEQLILDDSQARAFVRNNLGVLVNLMTGTVGFLRVCYRIKILPREVVLQVLLLIEKSSFHIDGEVLSKVRSDIERS